MSVYLSSVILDVEFRAQRLLEGCFGSEECAKCGESIPKMYPDTFYYMRCFTRVRRELLLDKIDFGRAVEWQFRQDLAEFLAYDVVRRQKLHSLRCSLLAWGSPFRNLTTLWKPMTGTGDVIVQEDVIDHILSFLKTVSS